MQVLHGVTVTRQRCHGNVLRCFITFIGLIPNNFTFYMKVLTTSAMDIYSPLHPIHFLKTMQSYIRLSQIWLTNKLFFFLCGRQVSKNNWPILKARYTVNTRFKRRSVEFIGCFNSAQFQSVMKTCKILHVQRERKNLLRYLIAIQMDELIQQT